MSGMTERPLNKNTLVERFALNPWRLMSWVLAFLLISLALKLDKPLMYKYREGSTLLLCTLAAFLIMWTLHMLKRKRGRFPKQFELIFFLVVPLTAIGIMVHDTAVFHYRKHIVLNTPPLLLNKLGQHFIVGYKSPEEIRGLLEKQAIGGVYVTARNVHQKTFAEIQQELLTFQTIATKNNSSPLFLSADQEGGIVSRLSPPLQPLPPLADIVRSATSLLHRDDLVKTYATAQAKQLSALGVNLNLSPVVDQKTDHLNHKLNIHSRVDQRAISSNIETVTQVAAIYCTTSLNHGVRPTLKHFPGLGSVSEDTHFRTGTLEGSRKYLENNDWRPFREIISSTDPFIMLGHVRVPAVDPAFPASLSPAIIDIIRQDWKFEGILITDDFNMGAIAGRGEGIGGAAVRAMNAGADLILLSYDPSQYYHAMFYLIKAYRNKTLDRTAIEASSRRLSMFKPDNIFQGSVLATEH